MTWTHHECHLPIFESEEAEKKYMEEEEAAQTKRVAEREQFIMTEQRPAMLGDNWLAHLVGDWRCGHGVTEERAIGNLWLMYSHEIIERIRQK